LVFSLSFFLPVFPPISLVVFHLAVTSTVEVR
jgi:hypothetical protein